MKLRERLLAAWYTPHLTPVAVALVPFAVLFATVAAIRRGLYRVSALPRMRLPVPVVVVGNITAGGTGKTPLVIALAQALIARGWHPGVISRGHGRKRGTAARMVGADTSVEAAGDEPLLIARRGIPVAVGAARGEAGRALLLAQPQCDVLIADDGLQHYALRRDIEIVVIDGARGLGNGHRLPAGPLREGRGRLRRVDAVVINETGNDTSAMASQGAFTFRLVGETFTNLAMPARTAPASAFTGRAVHAIAGIGNPDRFFATLRRMGITPVCHAYPDHYRYVPADLALAQAQSILMTEKDAVKCAGFADARCWYLPVTATIDAALVDRINRRLEIARDAIAAAALRPSPRPVPRR